jgi:hypothetical protein
LKMTFEAEVGVADRKELGIDGTVRGVANGTAFASGFVLEDIRTSLRGVAPQTALIFGEQGGATKGTTQIDGPFVRGVAIGTAHFALRDGMMAWQTELGPDVGMTIETANLPGSVLGHSQIRAEAVGARTSGGEAEGRLYFPTRLRMQAAGAMTGFTTGIIGVGTRSN